MSPTQLHDIQAAAKAIIEAHRASVGLEAGGDEAAAPPVPTSDTPVYLAALEACTALGFIPADAECVARAWQRMADRTGTFDVNAWPETPEDFDLQPWPRGDAFPDCPQALGLYAVLPTAEWVGRMARCGVPTVQLRFKSEDPEAIQREVRAAVEAVRGTEALLFINDHWQAAIDAGAYGVHLGQEDMDEANLDAIRAAGLRLGLSTHGYAEMCKADAASPSYIAMGAVYPTTLKRMATAPQGVGRLKRYAKLMHDHSLVAIGGIDAERMPDVLESGVGSIAVVRAITGVDEPEKEAVRLTKLVAKNSLA